MSLELAEQKTGSGIVITGFACAQVDGFFVSPGLQLCGLVAVLLSKQARVDSIRLACEVVFQYSLLRV